MPRELCGGFPEITGTFQGVYRGYKVCTGVIAGLGFPMITDSLLWGPYNRDYTILVHIGASYWGNYPVSYGFKCCPLASACRFLDEYC